LGSNDGRRSFVKNARNAKNDVDIENYVKGFLANGMPE
jgi:hypothetical protein